MRARLRRPAKCLHPLRNAARTGTFDLLVYTDAASAVPSEWCVRAARDTRVHTAVLVRLTSPRCLLQGGERPAAGEWRRVGASAFILHTSAQGGHLRRVQSRGRKCAVMTMQLALCRLHSACLAFPLLRTACMCRQRRGCLLSPTHAAAHYRLQDCHTDGVTRTPPSTPPPCLPPARHPLYPLKLFIVILAQTR